MLLFGFWKLVLFIAPFTLDLAGYTQFYNTLIFNVTLKGALTILIFKEFSDCCFHFVYLCTSERKHVAFPWNIAILLREGKAQKLFPALQSCMWRS